MPEHGTIGFRQQDQQQNKFSDNNTKHDEMARVLQVGEARPLTHQHEKNGSSSSTQISTTHTASKAISASSRAGSKVVINDTLAAIKRKQKVLDMKKSTGGGPATSEHIHSSS